MNSNNYIILNNTQDSIPRATAGTGTITSVNNKEKIIGVGTSFLSEFQINDFIYIKAQNEFSKVVSIESDTELTIDRKFTVDLAASAFHITQKSRYKEVSWEVTGAGNATIDGQSFVQGEGATMRKDTSGSYGQNTFTPPIDINATGTVVKVMVDF